LQYLITRDVFPTPWAPRTTILASSDDMIIVDGRVVCQERRGSLGAPSKKRTKRMKEGRKKPEAHEKEGKQKRERKKKRS
jgi:hypothetical protein